MSVRMRFKLVEDLNYSGLIPLTEANLNRVVNGHDKTGYVILSASRETLWETPHGIVGREPEDKTNVREISPGSQEHLDINNKRYKELRTEIYNRGYSFIPVYGGFKEEGQDEATTEKSLIVYPFNIKSSSYSDFDEFLDNMFELGCKYDQDAILVKYADRNPRYYDPRTKAPADDYEFVGTSLHDITQMYFTALKKWDDISHKKNFTYGKPQRWTFECYMNNFPNTIAEHRIRSNKGELVRFKNYP